MGAGYSETPLARKLSFNPGLRAWFEDMPASVAKEIGDPGLVCLSDAEAPIDAVHIFVTRRADLEARIHRLLPLLAPTGFIRVSWPKKASEVATDIDEDTIREVILPGRVLVDVKVCAIDETWSGLKLMIRREMRTKDIAKQSQ